MRVPLLLLCSVSVVAAPAFAQDAPDDLEEIQITATRIPLARGEIAAPVTVITSEDLVDRGIFRISDALDQVPGLAIQRGASVGGQTQIRLRGSEANQTLILIDGVEANDPAAGDEVQLENLVTADIARIEIVRGPQSVVWGSDALAGVINIITKKEDKPFSASAFAEGGSFGTFRTGGTLGTSGDIWSLRGGISYTDQRGVNVSREGDEDDGYENLTFNIKGTLDPVDWLSIVATARHSDATAEFDSIDFTTGFPTDSDSFSETENTYLSLGADGTFWGGKITPSLRLTYLDTEIDNFAADLPNGSTAAERFGVYGDLDFNLFEGHSLTLLVDHEDTEFTQEGIASPFGDPNQVQNQDVTGLAANYSGQILEGLTVTGSVRRDINSFFDDITTWRAGASYASPYAGFRFYFSIGRGQKDPTFTELFGFFADQFIGNPDLQPEESLNTEIGWEQDWFSGALTTRVSYFTADLENEINGFIFDPTTFLFTAENVVGESERDGIEVDINWRASETLSINASYAYLDAVEPDGMGGFQEEIRRPDHTATLAVNWQPIPRLNINVVANYQGEAVDIFFPPFPEPSTLVDLDDYILINVNARYRLTDNIEIYGRIENLADEDYEDVIGFNTPDFGAFAGVRVRY